MEDHITPQPDSRIIDPTLAKQPDVERFLFHLKAAFGDVKDEMISDYEVVDEFYEHFAPAVAYINKQSVVGVAAEYGEIPESGRRMSWLTVVTESQVYLFDILQLGKRAFKTGLAFILESNCILKVIHDCRDISGCLKAEFGVELTNVFDTQVADVMCFRAETGGFLPNRVSRLEETLSLRFTMSSSELSPFWVKSQISVDQKVWYIRPCPEPLLKLMTASVVHLLSLRLILQAGLMADFNREVSSYVKSWLEPDYLGNIGSGKDPLDLPDVFKKTNTMKQERQMQATSRYLVVAEDTVARFRPPPRPSSEASSKNELPQSTPTVLASVPKEKTMGRGMAFGRESSFAPLRQIPPPWSGEQSQAGINSPHAAETSHSDDKPTKKKYPETLSEYFRTFRDM